MKKNYISIILCFLCCCLVLNVVSIPARALDPVTVGYCAISAVVGVACIMQALGYMAASNSEPFTNSVNACVDYLTESTSFVSNGMLIFAGYRSGQLSSMYAMRDLVQVIWQWLFDSNTIEKTLYNKFDAGYTWTSYKGATYRFAGLYPSYSFTISYTDSSLDSLFYAEVFACPGSTSYYLDGGSIRDCSNIVEVIVDGVSYTTGLVGSKPISSDVPSELLSASYVGVFSPSSSGITSAFEFACKYYIETFLSGSISNDYFSIYGTLGQIQSPYQTVGTDEEIIEIEIAPVYIDWIQTGKEFPDPNNPDGDDPDNDGKFPMWLPTGIPSRGYDDSVITQNQQQSQSGVSSGDITFEPYEPDDPGTGGGAGSGTDLSSVVQAIINVPTAIVSGIGNFISDFFGFNGNPDDYLVQFRDFFPFCIPFDLYDFITVLSAEPEAPVFHWEIPVPQLGQTFELEVDLSAWDDIAVLFRNLELLAFIFGLAIITREKFLRS